MIVSNQSDDLFAHSHLFPCHIHVPDDHPSIWAAGDEVMSGWSIAQALNFIPEEGNHKQSISSTKNIKIVQMQSLMVYIQQISMDGN